MSPASAGCRRSDWEERTVAEGTPADNAAVSERGLLARIGSDWWATILGLAVTALAVAGVLPKIPW
ncbi:hypothetical protein A5784_00415 [Mycobacterium sp. 852013-50091_SCH5140682]|nr:hypothetical protein A5784_00415 [Mycobacterium sp. 852013-50091_SCH5140682]